MRTIDYIYRFDPKNPSVKPPPEDAEVGRQNLENGNRLFSEWMRSCRTGSFSTGEPRYVVQCNGLEVGMVRSQGEMPRQAPFAVVVGCSDARVPPEMLFGQGFNDLFVIRVAGNVLADECWGSIDYAINALSESVKLVVVLGHGGCGAVTAAVDAYLNPLKYSSARTSYMLRSILHRIFVPVHQAANGLLKVWGPDAPTLPDFRRALIESAVCLNAAHAAYNLYSEAERSWKSDIQVLYGVYNLFTHQVSMPPASFRLPLDEVERRVNLAYAPTHPREFDGLAVQIADLLRPTATPKLCETEPSEPGRAAS
ncbi:MAG: carbonic anhydrase [Planctomycetaceae bacterium]